MKITTIHAQLFAALAAGLIGGSLITLELQSAALQRACVERTGALAECTLRIYGR